MRKRATTAPARASRHRRWRLAADCPTGYLDLMQVKALIVDDHEAMREVIRAMLESRQDVVIVGEAGDGREAVRAAADAAPELVVMDVAMPKMGGAEAAREIVRSFPEVKILALSNYADKRLVRDMFDAGAQAYVLKEEAFHDLFAAVDALLSGGCYLGRGVAL